MPDKRIRSDLAQADEPSAPEQDPPSDLDEFERQWRLDNVYHDEGIDRTGPAQGGLGIGTYSPVEQSSPQFGEVVIGRGGWPIKDSTRSSYERHANRLWQGAKQRNARFFGEGVPVKPMDVVHHLNSICLPLNGVCEISEQTWMTYRTALLWDLSRSQDPEFVFACKELEAMRVPSRDPSEGALLVGELDFGIAVDEMPVKTRRRKGIRESDLKRLIDQLGTMNRPGPKGGRWGMRTQWWIQAGIATGLRPGEWEHAEWADDSHTLLLAPTSKVKASPPAYARSSVLDASDTQPGLFVPNNLPVREIPVDPSDSTFVEQHLAAIHEVVGKEMPFKQYQEYCRQTLWRACRRLWAGKKTYSLYSARHQFSANSRGKMTRDQLAQVLGHSRRDTARFYAGAREAYRRSGVSPKVRQEESQSDSHEQSVPYVGDR
jgi:integrase